MFKLTCARRYLSQIYSRQRNGTHHLRSKQASFYRHAVSRVKLICALASEVLNLPAEQGPLHLKQPSRAVIGRGRCRASHSKRCDLHLGSLTSTFPDCTSSWRHVNSCERAFVACICSRMVLEQQWPRQALQMKHSRHCACDGRATRA